MRFDSEEYLAQWRDSGRFPAIHNDLFDLIAAYSRAPHFLDLCCSTGLLGQRIRDHLGGYVIGIDADRGAIDAAKSAGVAIEIHEVKVSSDTLASVQQLIVQNSISCVIARRCFPELFGDDRSLGLNFIDMIADSGVTELFLEGRIETAKATNPLKSVSHEVDIARHRFRVRQKVGACVFLQRELI